MTRSGVTVRYRFPRDVAPGAWRFGWWNIATGWPIDRRFRGMAVREEAIRILGLEIIYTEGPIGLL